MRKPLLAPLLVLAALAAGLPAVHAQSTAERLGQALGATRSPRVSEGEAAGGVKEALAQGVQRAVTQLGRKDGYYGDDAVRIGLPKQVRGLAEATRRLGGGRKVDAFERAMNRAAERAVPVAADIFADAVRQMTVRDALDIVRGGDDAGTRFFRRVAGERLRTAFLPIVARATDEAGVTRRYKALTGGGGGLLGALGQQESLDLDAYVTDAALDGLFHVVAEQERAIRRDPARRSTELLRKVFGR